MGGASPLLNIFRSSMIPWVASCITACTNEGFVILAQVAEMTSSARELAQTRKANALALHNKVRAPHAGC